jgi:hypothetical protein
MDKLTLDETIQGLEARAEELYIEGMLCHANPDDGKLDENIQTAKDCEQLVEWLKELRLLRRNINNVDKRINEELELAIKDKNSYVGTNFNATQYDRAVGYELALTNAIEFMREECLYSEQN